MSLFEAESGRSFFDVCVVGAGIGGLRVALVLARAGYSVCVLEARDRVGGRTLTHTFRGGGTFDLGGQWLGPKQRRMNALVTELGLDTVTQEWFVSLMASEENPFVRSGAEKTLSQSTRDDLKRIAEKFKERMENLGEESDTQTVREFVETLTNDKTAAQEVDLFVCNSLACTADDVSLYSFLHFVKACGGFHEIGDGRNGAQNHTILGGAQLVSTTLAKSLLEFQNCDIRLAEPVKEVRKQTDGLVRFTTKAGVSVVARRGVLALAPTLWKDRITFVPELSKEKCRLRDEMTSGRVIKVVCIYRNIFWEVNRQGADGKDTQGDLSAGPVRNLFPARVGSYPALVGLITADHADRFKNAPEVVIKYAVLAQIETFFDTKEARDSLIDFYCIDWSSERYSGGCFEALPPKGLGVVLVKHGSTHENKLHFTCAEFGREWPGYMEGAIESADRVAEEIQRELGIVAV